MKSLKGSLVLLLTALIWGSAFVAQTSGADSVGTFTFNASRCFIAAAFLGIVLLVIGLKAKKRSPWPIKEGVICGVLLFAAMSFQQAGISLYPDGVAASGRAGFLTATYVIMVALFSIFRGKRQHILVYIAAVLCITGIYMICVANGFAGIYLGDWMELTCALVFTMHIIMIERYSEADSIKLSFIQFVICTILSTVMMLAFEDVQMVDIQRATMPILYAGVMSSGVAYTLQMVGQKYAPSNVASIILSLESVFAVLTGFVVLNEVLSPRELIGCALVFFAVILAQCPTFIKKEVL